MSFVFCHEYCIPSHEQIGDNHVLHTVLLRLLPTVVYINKVLKTGLLGIQLFTWQRRDSGRSNPQDSTYQKHSRKKDMGPKTTRTWQLL